MSGSQAKSRRRPSSASATVSNTRRTSGAHGAGRPLTPGHSRGIAFAGALGNEWLPADAEWQRAEVSGRVKKPKLESDLAKLKQLFVHCREANLREVRALVFHFPYLLTLTNDHGFTALHHAEMSGDAEFTAKLLELYHDPRCFTSKFVKFESEEELRLDGIRLHTSSGRLLRSSRSGHESSGGPEEWVVVVRHVPDNSLTTSSGVVPGDILQAVNSRVLVDRQRQYMLAPDDILEIINGRVVGGGFPATLEFRGPACAEIVCADGWSPLHASAGGGPHFRKVFEVLAKEQQKVCRAARDGHGCTPEYWSLIHKRSCGRRRRPLSAGPGGAGRQPRAEARLRREALAECERASLMARSGKSCRPQFLPDAPPCFAEVPLGGMAAAPASAVPLGAE